MMLVARLLLALAVIVDVSAAAAQGAKPQTIINGIPLTEQQKAEFRRMYGVAPLAGAFGGWQDAAWAAQSRNSGGAHYYRDGMGVSVAVSSGCATGSTGTGSGRVDFIVGCD